jgi:hypothetical protein
MYISTNPPGAVVYVNDKLIGPSPVDYRFIYYGSYRIKIEADGYQTLVVNQEITAPVYEYPPIDLIVENVNPFIISDRQPFHYDLAPMPRTNVDELRSQGEQLRERGHNLPPPSIPPDRLGRPTDALPPGSPPRPAPAPTETLPPPEPKP